MEPVQILATVAVFGVVVKGTIDAIRRAAPSLHGFAVQALAIVIGGLIAWVFDLRATEALLANAGAGGLRVPPAALDYLISGVAMAFTAGFFAEISGSNDDTG